MEFKWYTYNDAGLEDGFEIRREVFCKEVGFSEEFEFDELDKTSLHLVCYDDGVAVCNARIYEEHPGVWHFGRLCSPKQFRGKGYGKATVTKVIEKCKEMNASKMVLGAKYDKKGFYESLGCCAFGYIYEEEGIPHIMMQIEIGINRDLFDIPHHANMFALIYKAAQDMYGEKGALAADEGTKLYGQQRGGRMAQRAVKDGAPLTMESYLLYGEWVDKNGHSTNRTSATEPVYCMECVVCGWCEAWKNAGLLEWGKNYCTYVDKNLVKGFNPELVLDIHSVLSQGGEVCAFQWNGFAMTDPDGYSAKKAALGNRTIKDFLYHTGHLLNAMTQAIAKELGADAAEKIKEKALADYTVMYGKEMADAVVKESQQDFTVVEY